MLVKKKMHKRSLFIFRRDLRLHDNTALNAALAASDTVVPLFILDPRQVGEENQFSRNYPAMYFMRNSLLEVHKELQEAYSSQLNILCGTSPEVIGSVLQEAANGIEAVYFNKDYTPFSQARDAKIAEICGKSKVAVHSYDDALLHAPGSVLNKHGYPLDRFFQFKSAALQATGGDSGSGIRRPAACPVKTDGKGTTTGSFDSAPLSVDGKEATSPTSTSQLLDQIVPKECIETQVPQMYRQGGRAEAVGILKKIGDFSEYAARRDEVANHTTTGMSCHLKFGTVSTREMYWQVKDVLSNNTATNKAGEKLIDEMYWREFFTHVGYHNPHVYEGKSMYKKYDTVRWADHTAEAPVQPGCPKEEMSVLERWKRGLTGFPFVDAGMRELNETGFMHNRTRQVVASFLTKDLHLHWRHGEKYFAEKLVDYDPAVNNGSWQWVGSTGCDGAAYLRIFNPWMQAERYDPDAVYIKKWVPELRGLTARDIHKWNNVAYNKAPQIHYPVPMCDHGVESYKANGYYGIADESNGPGRGGFGSGKQGETQREGGNRGGGGGKGGRGGGRQADRGQRNRSDSSEGRAATTTSTTNGGGAAAAADHAPRGNKKQRNKGRLQ